MIRSLSISAALSVLTGAATALHAQEAPPAEATIRVLIDRTLAEYEVRLVSLGADSLEVLDIASGRPQTLPRTSVLALVPPLTELDQAVIDDRILTGHFGDERVRLYGRLDLVDGQSLIGNLLPIAPGATSAPSASKVELFGWDSKLFGPLALPLESAILIALLPDRAGPLDEVDPKATQDLALLVNGDRAEGFVSGLGASLQVEKSGKTTELPISRVVGVRLSNSPKPARGVWVWLYDATVVGVSSLSVDASGHTSLTGSVPGLAQQRTVAMDGNDLRAICLDAALLRPLAALPSSIREAPGETPRHWTAPLKIGDHRGVPLDAPDIELPGPMIAEWTLPQGAARVCATFELPPSARLWGDCDVTVECQGKVLMKEHLNAQRPVAHLNAGVGGGTLRVTLAAGPRGPIQDRVVLRRGLVLLEPSGPSGTPAPRLPAAPR